MSTAQNTGQSEMEYSQFASNKFSLDTFLSGGIAESLDEKKIGGIVKELEKFNDKAKREALRIITGSFELLAGTMSSLDAFGKVQLPNIREKTQQASSEFKEFQENFSNLIISAKYSKYSRNQRHTTSATPFEQTDSSAVNIKEEEWMQKRAEFEALSGLLENFYSFVQDKERYLVAKCAGIDEIYNPILKAHPAETCMFFLCNDVLLIGFQSKSQPDKIAVQGCFNLLDVQFESYGNELRISLSPQLAYEYRFATVEFLSAFLEVFNTTVLSHKKDIVRYLYSLIRHRLEDKEEQNLTGFVAKNKNIEVFKRKNQAPTSSVLDSFQEESFEWSLSKLNYIYQQIQSIDEFIHQIDFDKAVHAALGARLSLSNLTLSVGEKSSAHVKLTAFLQSIQDFLQSKVDGLYKTLCNELNKSFHSKTKTLEQLGRLIRLGYAKQARNVFLQTRNEFIKIRTSQIIFDSTIQSFVSSFCRIVFAVLRNTAQLYPIIFSSDDTSHLIEWCNDCLMELVYKIKRHLFQTDNSFSSICESIVICFKECDEKMKGTGLFLTPFLENYFLPELLQRIEREEERISSLIPISIQQESLEEPDKEILELLMMVCSKELAHLLVTQLMQGSQPFKSVCNIFTEIYAYLQGLCNLLPAEMIGFAVRGLLHFSNVLIDALSQEQERIFETLLCLQIFFSKIYPQFQMFLEEKVGKPLSELTAFHLDVLEPTIFQSLKPRFKELIVPLIAKQLLSSSCYTDDATFVEGEVKRPTRSIIYFCETINYFYQLDKFDLLNELFEATNFTAISFPLKGLHRFIADLFYLQTVTSADNVAPGLKYAFDYYKRNLDGSPIIDKNWSDEEFYANYLQFLQPTS